MALLPRLWLRQITKIAIGFSLLSLFVLFVDFYFNFLPTSVHTHLPIFQPGEVVIDVKIETCLTLTGCLGEEKDGWYRVPRNLYLGNRWGRSGFLFAKRVKEEELRNDSVVVLDIAIAPEEDNNSPAAGIPQQVFDDIKKAKPSLKDAEITAQLAKEKFGWKLTTDSLWIKYGKFDMRNALTAVNVLYGPDAVDPRPGWVVLKHSLVPGAKLEPRLSLRYGSKQTLKKPELKLKSDGKFKILQAADFHFSTGVGKCRDPFPVLAKGEQCEADPRTLAFFNQVLDQEQPDMVVFTGDQIFGEDAPDSPTALLKVVKPVIDRKIPYAMVFGNHDADAGSSMNKPQLMDFIASLPYSLSEAGPSEISGVGNYLLTVKAHSSDHPAVTLYFLDSHDRALAKGNSEYDWIKDDQNDYLKKLHKAIKPFQDEYTHIPLSMAFFHIPLPEYLDPGHVMIGQAREGCAAPKHNSGTKQVLTDIGVTVVSVGHDHVNDYCMFHDGNGEKGEKGKNDADKDSDKAIWLCYGGAAGEGGYGGYGGYERRFRLFEIDSQSGSILTWKLKRNAVSEPFDKHMMVKGGKALK